MNSAKRVWPESYVHYKSRMQRENRALKAYLKGRVIWPSAHLEFPKVGEVIKKIDNGTYVQKIHGDIGHSREKNNGE